VTWFVSNKDIVGLSIALLAIVVSLTTVLLSRRQQQASSFLAVQELMLSNELQRGRLLIYSAGISGKLPSFDSDDFKLMIRALAVFDLMAPMLAGESSDGDGYWTTGIADYGFCAPGMTW
jgi:hypothetical protein